MNSTINGGAPLNNNESNARIIKAILADVVNLPHVDSNGTVELRLNCGHEYVAGINLDVPMVNMTKSTYISYEDWVIKQ